MFKVLEGCPKTCLNLDGNYDCGKIDKEKDCYCDSDYVLINGQCSSTDVCGCKVNDLGIIISVNN